MFVCLFFYTPEWLLAINVNVENTRQRLSSSNSPQKCPLICLGVNSWCKKKKKDRRDRVGELGVAKLRSMFFIGRALWSLLNHNSSSGVFWRVHREKLQCEWVDVAGNYHLDPRKTTSCDIKIDRKRGTKARLSLETGTISERRGSHPKAFWGYPSEL